MRVRLAHHDTGRELCHGVHILGERSDQLLLMGRELAASKDFLLESFGLRLTRELTSEQQPEDTLWNGLATRDCLGSLGLHLTQGVTTIGNTLHGV